ncbi:hypothetical protein [Campylobacter concisus]|uniref:hypothetical protein n=1 Tax=Campylobacter concisus TaxID=199 RepID=UPI000CD99F9C|nr:hypothetical protein [Campylobacter concisus]
MIIYDKNGQILAMGDISLGLLEFKDIREFLSEHKDIDELVLDYKEPGVFIDYLAKRPNLRVNLKTKNGKILNATLKFSKISSVKNEEYFELLILDQTEIYSQNQQAAMKAKTKLRLPNLKVDEKELLDKEEEVLNESWFSETASFLNLSKNEFATYLGIFLSKAKDKMIFIQSAVQARDTKFLEESIKILKEPALNLKITPLVANFDALLTRPNKIKKIAQINERLSEISTLCNKFSKRLGHES